MKEFLFYGFNAKDDTRAMALLFLRLFVGLMMLTHGWAKLASFSDTSVAGSFPDPIGLGSSLSLTLVVLAEFGASLMVILGVFTRLAVIPLIINMIVAVFIIHATDAFATKELAVMYLGVYVSLFFLGSGRFSVDYILFSHKPESSWEDCINVGDVDRLSRLAFAVILIVLYLFGIFSGFWSVLALLISAVMIFTGISGFCPPYSLFGISTQCKRKKT